MIHFLTKVYPSLNIDQHGSPSFVQSTLGSMMSIYSDAGDYGTVEVSGQVVFSLRYDEHTQSLQVFIKECQDLAYGDASRKLSNP